MSSPSDDRVATEYSTDDVKEGRLTFDSFEAAMDAFHLAVENMTAARSFVAERDFVEFYLPPSRTYVAMITRGGERPSAWINKGFIDFKNDDGTSGTIILPRNAVTGRGRSSPQRRREESEKSACSTCGMILPSSGVCQYC